MRSFPAKIIEKEIDRDPAEEENLIDIILSECVIVIFWPTCLQLSMGCICENATDRKSDWNIDLYHNGISRLAPYSVREVSVPAKGCVGAAPGNSPQQECVGGHAARTARAEALFAMRLRYRDAPHVAE